MTPLFKITADGADITENIKTHLVEIQIVDEAGSLSDRLTIIVADSGPTRIRIPDYGADMHVSLGYQEENPSLIEVGKYRFDEVEIRSDKQQGRRVELRARAADTQNPNALAGFHACHNRDAWTNHTIGQIVADIAAEHNLKPLCSPKFANMDAGTRYQISQSDGDFLQVLAASVGALCKVGGRTLVFAETGAGLSATGDAIAPVTIHARDITSFNYVRGARGKYRSVTAHWRDASSNTSHRVHAGKGQPHYNMRDMFPDAVTAQREADAELKRIAMGLGRLRMILPGNPRLTAEGRVVVKGLDEAVDGNWRPHRVTHYLTKEGYHSDLDCDLTSADTITEEGYDYSTTDLPDTTEESGV